MRVDQRVELLGRGLHQRPMRTSAGVVDEDVKVLAAPLCLQRFDLHDHRDGFRVLGFVGEHYVEALLGQVQRVAFAQAAA